MSLKISFGTGLEYLLRSLKSEHRMEKCALLGLRPFNRAIRSNPLMLPNAQEKLYTVSVGQTITPSFCNMDTTSLTLLGSGPS